MVHLSFISEKLVGSISFCIVPPKFQTRRNSIIGSAFVVELREHLDNHGYKRRFGVIGTRETCPLGKKRSYLTFLLSLGPDLVEKGFRERT